jgi:hypothetical protein
MFFVAAQWRLEASACFLFTNEHGKIGSNESTSVAAIGRTHVLLDLVKLAGLETIRTADADANPTLAENWLIAKDWNEQARYETRSHEPAKKLYRAIVDKSNGVMKWIKAHW